MVQLPAPDATLQSTPEPDGSGSLIAPPVAVPAPLFVAVTVNPICEPALTESASAVLVRLRLAHWTTTLAKSLSPPVPLVVDTLALFLTVPQSAGVVGAVMWIAVSEPGPSTWLKSQVSTSLPTAPLIAQPV